MRLRLSSVFGVLALACALAGCRSGETTDASGTKVIKLAFVTNNSADFWTIVQPDWLESGEFSSPL